MRRAAAALVLAVAACTGGPGGPSAPTPTTSPPDGAAAPSAPGRGGDDPPPDVTLTPPGPSPADSSPLTCWSAPIESAEPAAGAPAFEDVTEAFALVAPLTGMHGHAAAFGDVDDDRHVDLAFGTFGDRSPDTYAVRGADGPRADQLVRGGDPFGPASDLVSELARTSGAAFADLDGDGDDDLLLVRNADEPPASLLLENDGGVLRPAAEPLPDEFRGRTPAVADFDRDGLLDVYVSEDRHGDVGGVLLHNQGSLSFVDVTAGSGLEGVHALGATAADLDRDGVADLVTSERVFHGRGDLTFDDVTPDGFGWERLGADDDPAGVAVGDVDRDGLPDIAVGHHYRSIVEKDEEVAVRLFRNAGTDAGVPTFVEVTEAAGLPPLPTLAPHVAWADLDNDGWLDLVTSGSAADGDRPAVFRNEGGSFEVPAGLGSTQYWVGAPVADLDLDGRLDVFGVEWEPDRPSRLFRNVTRGGHWLAVSVDDPVGGVGAVVEVAADGDLVAWQEIGVSGGYSSGTPAVAHLGVGTAERVRVTITPAGGQPVVVDDVPVDQHLRWPDGC